MDQMKPSVCIVILHYQDVQMLSDCLTSLSKLSTNTVCHQIIVVDNSSHLNEDIMFKTSTFPILPRIITSHGNYGYAKGNNIGMKEALHLETDYILLLNDDTVVSPSFLDILIDMAEETSNMGMMGPKIYYFHEPEKVWFAGARFNTNTCMLTTPRSNQMDEGTDSEPIESDYITGCALLVKRATIEKIGLLDERFFLYWEDMDWGIRAKKAGFKNLIIPSSHIWHKVSVSSGGMDSLIRVYHKTRSHLLMARLHAPQALPKLHVQFFRDVAWLLFKSKDVNRFKKAHAYIAAIRDYYMGKTDKGPPWLWNS